MYKKILCPVDGSKISNRGLRQAIRLAAALNSKLILLHVLDNTALLVRPAEVGTLADYLEAEARKILQRAAKIVERQGGSAQTQLIELRSGRVAEAITQTAKKMGVDLIVMGTHGRRGLSGLLLGSDAAVVVGTGTVPVLLVK